MATKKVDGRTALGQSGIFGPDWPKWRGAILEVRLPTEPAFLAHLDDVRPSKDAGLRSASLMELDRQLRPVQPRTLPWPPEGSVRVIRTP